MDPAREAYWRRRFGSSGLSPGPVGLGHLRVRFHTTIVMSSLLALIGLIVLAIFAGFGRPDVGLRIFGFLFLPIVLWTWLEFAVLRRRVRAYLRERDRPSNGDGPPG